MARRYRVAANCDTRRYREAVMVAPGHARQKSAGVKSFAQITQGLKPYMGQ